MESRREVLMKMTVDQLRKYAVTIGVKNVRSFRKSSLVDEIVLLEAASEAEDKGSRESVKESAVEPCKRDEQKTQYIETAEIGTIVAFKLPNGKVKSAKIIRRSSSKKRFLLETNYGDQYIVPYDDVVWVRYGNRWPRGIYNLLKGITRYGELQC